MKGALDGDYSMRPFLITTAYLGLATLAALERKPIVAILYLTLAVFHITGGGPLRRS